MGVRMMVLMVSLGLMFAGCAGQQQRSGVERETVAISGDGWSMNVELGAWKGSCVVVAASFTNGKTQPWSTSFWTVTVLNSSNSTIGEVMVTCPTTFPGGSGNCSLVQQIVYPCQPVKISVRGSGMPK